MSLEAQHLSPQEANPVERHSVEHTAQQIGRIANTLGNHMYMEGPENNFNMLKDISEKELPGGIKVVSGGEGSFMQEQNSHVTMSGHEGGINIRTKGGRYKTVKRPVVTEIDVKPQHITSDFAGNPREADSSVVGTETRGYDWDKSTNKTSRVLSLQETRDAAAHQLRRIKRDKQEAEKRAS